MGKTLKDCLDSSNNSLIIHNLVFMYPYLDTDVVEYAKVLDTLRSILPTTSSEGYMQGMLLVVQEYDNPPFIVSGQNGKTQKEWGKESGEFADDSILSDDQECFALDMNPWSEWLGLPISSESLVKFADSQIVAHCLVEMCRSGFTEESIQAYRQNLQKELESAEGGPFLPSEEVFKMIREKLGLL
jgi:hypothetical protein